MITYESAAVLEPSPTTDASTPTSAKSANVIARSQRLTAREEAATADDATTSDSSREPGSKRFTTQETTTATMTTATMSTESSANTHAHSPTQADAADRVSEKDLVQVFKLLADETRLKILLSLQREGELHVSALCDRLGQSQPAVSHHLALLRDAGLIRPRRDGKHNYYSVRREHFQTVMSGLFENIVEAESPES